MKIIKTIWRLVRGYIVFDWAVEQYNVFLLGRELTLNDPFSFRILRVSIELAE